MRLRASKLVIPSEGMQARAQLLEGCTVSIVRGTIRPSLRRNDFALISLLWPLFVLVSMVGCAEQRSYTKVATSNFLHDSASDFKNLYTSKRSWTLGPSAFAMGAVMAHTDIDQDLHDWVQNDVRSSGTDSASSGFKTFGEGKYLLPATAAAMLTGQVLPESEAAGVVGEWGNRTFRAGIAGVPALLFTQAATGASRPGESSAESDWVPFHDNNGVSGHAFVGALPFMTAAQMTDNRWLKGGLYGGSALTGLSRINDGAHYSSQVLIGWSLAYLSTKAVDDTNDERSLFELTPVPTAEGMGLGVTIDY